MIPPHQSLDCCLMAVISSTLSMAGAAGLAGSWMAGMLVSGWEVGSNGVRIYWPGVSMLHNILTLARNTPSLSTMMSTTQPIPGQKLMTGQAVLSWPGLLA